MNNKMNLIDINGVHSSTERTKNGPKNILQFINSQYSNSLKNPFSNLMLRKLMIHDKIKNLNQMKKNLIKRKKENKIKVFKQNNLYINFSDFYEKNKHNRNESNNENNIFNHNNNYTKIGNSFDENYAFKNFRSKDLFSIRKFYGNRKIKPLKLVPQNRTINNLKIKSYSKENSDKEIVHINNKEVTINKMNIKIDHHLPKLIHLNDKIIHNTRQLLSKIDGNKIRLQFNGRNNNIVFRNTNNTNNTNTNNYFNVNSYKTSQVSV